MTPRTSVSGATSSLTYAAPVLRVTDLPRSIAFYRDRLGFALDFVYEGFYASVNRDGAHVHLQAGAPTPRDQAAFEQQEAIDVCLVVHGVAALAAAFAAAGVPFTVALRQMPYGEEFYVRDPDGYVLGFVQPAAE
ncbi:MAG TPA: VOC family protein [Methylomirabilota bacterium]|jgi:catechol 2,3-dioxygenase-like lactoylglutathione lyase family enzyme|nr:VOC family protein [Methylomirabilota bacterium]